MLFLAVCRKPHALVLQSQVACSKTPTTVSSILVYSLILTHKILVGSLSMPRQSSVHSSCSLTERATSSPCPPGLFPKESVSTATFQSCQSSPSCLYDSSKIKTLLSLSHVIPHAACRSVHALVNMD